MPDYDPIYLSHLFDYRFNEQLNNEEGSIKSIIDKIVLEQLNLNNKDILLDIGCGTGNFIINASKICKQVIGIDISKLSLEKAKVKVRKENVKNIILTLGSFENPSETIELSSYNITKITTIYSMHHLPDDLKKECIKTLSKLITKPGRIIIGDIIFFEDPEKHKDKYEEVFYDDHETDFPSKIEYLTNCFKDLNAELKIIKVHPLAGVLVADLK